MARQCGTSGGRAYVIVCRGDVTDSGCQCAGAQVASRRVVVISAVIMVIGSVLGKWSAVLIMIPEPVIGGLLIVLCGELSLTAARENAVDLLDVVLTR